MLELPPLSLYIHIPWCIRKCPYCDFNSHQTDGEIPEQQYIDALLQDFGHDLRYIQNREIQSIFIGGGTPSLFSASALERLISQLHSLASFSSHLEVTLEANPGSAEADRFKQYRSLGINRLSLGIQSFQDQHLLALGRIHDSAQAHKAIDMATAAGFDNFNLDLMYGLPQQTVAQAIADLDTAISFSPNHLSWYQLTIEPNTIFYHKPPVLPAEEPLFEIQEQGLLRITADNYQRYEVSAFARQNSTSIHNINYWSFGDYLGIGAGAHSKLSLPEDNRILRLRKLKQPSQYLNSPISYIAEHGEIALSERVIEFLMNGLRLTGGIDMRLMTSRAGIGAADIGDKVDELVAKDLLVRHDHILQATNKGYLFLNSLLQEFA